MQSKINEVVKNDPAEYPCLKKWTHSRDPERYVITLFLSKGYGVPVFKSEKSNTVLFEYDKYEEDEFEIFDGEVILSN